MGRQQHRAPDGAPVHYERHCPEQTALYWLVHQYAATFFADAEAAAGADLPQFVKDAFDAFLECGLLVHGFLVFAAVTAATTSWSPSAARSAASVRGAVPDAWRRRQRTWSTTSSPM